MQHNEEEQNEHFWNLRCSLSAADSASHITSATATDDKKTAINVCGGDDDDNAKTPTGVFKGMLFILWIKWLLCLLKVTDVLTFRNSLSNLKWSSTSSKRDGALHC